VQFLSLTIPLNSFSWILREEYIHGMPFTMDGKPVKIQALRPLPDAKAEKSIVEKTAMVPKNKGKKIIPFRPPQKRMKKGLEDLCAEMLRYKKLVTLHTLTLR